MAVLFGREETIKTIKNYINFLKTLNPSELFLKAQTGHCLSLLNIMKNAPAEWDEHIHFNEREISEDFIKALNKKGASKEELDLVFAYCIRFLLEFYLTTKIKFDVIYTQAKDFAFQHMDEFEQEARNHIFFAFNGMSTEMLKDVFSNEDFNIFKEYSQAKNSAEQLKNDWVTFINEKETEVKKLEKSLENHKHAFNFVMLNAGFESLVIQKKKQLLWSKIVMIVLGIILPSTVMLEIFYFSQENIDALSPAYYTRLIPMITLTFILVYYFRVSLINFNSIKAQILQIEFRQTLCSFIQSYAEYSSVLKSKNENSLSKFEDVIFSNIMISEDRIPSTFDGLDQLTKLIDIIKNGKNR